MSSLAQMAPPRRATLSGDRWPSDSVLSTVGGQTGDFPFLPPASTAVHPRHAQQASPPRPSTASDHPLPILPFDAALCILAALAGTPLSRPLSTDAYRAALPFASTCRTYYEAFTTSIRALDVLPVGFGRRTPPRSVVLLPAFVSIEPPVRRARRIGDWALRGMLEVLPQLAELQLSTAVRVTDAGLKMVAEAAPELQCLKLAGNHAVGDKGLDALRGCAGLKMLDLSFCGGFGDSAGKIIGDRFPLLEGLAISRWRVGDKFLHGLFEGGGRLTKLEAMDLSGLGISDRGIKVLVEGCGDRLISLQLRQCRQVTDVGLEYISEGCQLLGNLDIGYNDNCTGEGVSALGAMKSLRSLSLSQVRLVDNDTVAALAAESRLVSLNISWCGLLTDVSTEFIAKCLSLRDLNMSGVKNLTDTGVQEIASLPKLRSVKLCYCSNLTSRSAELLAAAQNAPLCEVDVRSLPALSADDLSILRRNCAVVYAADDEFGNILPARRTFWTARRRLPRDSGGLHGAGTAGAIAERASNFSANSRR